MTNSVPGFPPMGGEQIHVHPRSFDKGQRMLASAEATRRGVGLRMEVHSGHTEFWTDPTVEVGQIAVWSARTYKGLVEWDCILKNSHEDWQPGWWPKRTDESTENSPREV